MKTINNKCGGKKSGCCVEFELPYGLAPKHVTDKLPNIQHQAGTKKPRKTTSK